MRIGIDLGGTKIEGLALDPNGTTLARRRVASPQGDYQATVDAVAGLVEALEGDTAERGTVGIGIPGATSPQSGLVKNANSTWLIGHPFERDMAARLDRPVRTANDANCFALSEAVDGGGAGSRAVFGVILGTGVGGGIVVDRTILGGANAIAGEWGHNPLPWPTDDERPGAECYCGRHGCIETFLSGPALANSYLDRTGRRMSAADIAGLADDGEDAALQVIALYQERLARGLAAVINLLDPDIIVLGGGLSKVTSLYDAVPLLWQPFVFSDRVDTPLVPPVHGDAGGVRGAAWLWPEASR